MTIVVATKAPPWVWGARMKYREVARATCNRGGARLAGI
jgi:hypothetical protein